jgi:hypothetical protein
VNVQSVRGHRTASTLAPTTPKHAIAIHPAVATSPSASARPPRKDVVIAAAAIRMPARVRSSLTTLSCASSARRASSWRARSAPASRLGPWPSTRRLSDRADGVGTRSPGTGRVQARPGEARGPRDSYANVDPDYRERWAASWTTGPAPEAKSAPTSLLQLVLFFMLVAVVIAIAAPETGPCARSPHGPSNRSDRAGVPQPASRAACATALAYTHARARASSVRRLKTHPLQDAGGGVRGMGRVAARSFRSLGADQGAGMPLRDRPQHGSAGAALRSAAAL